MSQNRIKVSVIIPTSNSWETLKSCIRSIYKQSISPVEVIVVDNGSTDATSSRVRRSFPQVKLIKLEKNIGVTGGRNVGIQLTDKSSNYFLFFDHDMVADKKMLEGLIATSKQSSYIGIVTPKIFYLKDKKRIWSAGTNIDLLTGRVLFRGGKDRGQFDSPEEVQVAPAAFLVKRAVINKISGFDNRYFATYEDTDFCFRARREGFKTFYSPEAVAYHNISTKKTGERKRLIQRSYWVGRNRVLFMKDFSSNFYFFLFISPVYLIYFLKISLEEQDIKGVREFTRGYVAGIMEWLFARKLLIHSACNMYNIILKNK